MSEDKCPWHAHQVQVGMAIIAGNWQPADIRDWIKEKFGNELDRKEIVHRRELIVSLPEPAKFHAYCQWRVKRLGEHARY